MWTPTARWNYTMGCWRDTGKALPQPHAHKHLLACAFRCQNHRCIGHTHVTALGIRMPFPNTVYHSLRVRTVVLALAAILCLAESVHEVSSMQK